MEKIKKSFLAKLISVILIALLTVVFVFSSIALALGVWANLYSNSKNKVELNKLLMDGLRTASEDILSRTDVVNKSFPNVSENLMYEIIDEDGEILYSDVDKSKSMIFYSQNGYSRNYGYVYNEAEDVNSEEDGTVETTYFHGEIQETSPNKIKYVLTVHLKNELKEKDVFYYITHAYNFIENNEKALVQSVLFSGLAILLLFVYLMCSAGHKKGEDRIHVSRFDKFPIDVLLLLTACVIGIIIFMAMGAFDGIENCYNTSLIPFFLALCVFTAAVSSILVSVFCITSAVRFKTRTFIKSSLSYFVLSFILRKVKKFFGYFKSVIRKIPTIWKSVLIIFGILAVNFIVVIFSFEEEVPFLVVPFNLAVAISALLFCIMFSDIKNATEKIAKGNTDMKINTAKMLGDFKAHAENINSINDGIAMAVEQKMKSERFKTELITNVSHDIKTPLTSIINYVDLLSKQEIDNETAKGYIEVLSRQSSKLKKLIEDLLEASKASTGNLSVNLSKIEVGIVLSQAIGEYEERFSAQSLETVMNGCEKPMYISVDNRHIWRIFDNILNNIAKYAQPNTRIYIDVAEKAGKAEIVFKNISKDQLNISGEELTERFVRGDSSRNTEGSGLGLSIARSLAQLQKGTFDVQIDGDLFKVKLTFPIINE